MALQRKHGRKHKARVVPERESPRENLPPNLGSPTSAGEATTPNGGSNVFSTPVNFAGPTFSDTVGYTPPDSDGAVGPSDYLVAVNGRIRSYSKTGAIGALNADTDVFFSSVRGSDSTSDPRVIYDPLSDRWFVTMINVTQPAGNRILIAESNGPTITASTVWTYFQFQGDMVGPSPNADTGCFFDYDTAGVDKNALYIGTNNFCPTFFRNTTLFVVRKSDLLTGVLTVTPFRNLIDVSGNGPFTPTVANNWDPSATNGYLVGVDNAFFGKADMYRISNPGGTPTLSALMPITLAATQYPLAVKSQSTTTSFDALDDRMAEAWVIGGKLYTQHNVGVNASGVSSGVNRTAERWYEIQNINATPTVLNFGTIFDPAALAANAAWYWMGSMTVNFQGHALLGMSSAGPPYYANAAYATKPAGASGFDAPTNYTSTTSTLNYTWDGNPHRWGDYSMTNVDPCNRQDMWTIQEYVASTNNWGTRVLKVQAPPPATPATTSPSSVGTGLASVNVNLVGTSTDNSGFFDTGAGACRIQAAVSRGVTVNSVTYVDPTHVTLNLNTTAATAGSADITITNPNGLSKTGTGVLTLTSGGAGISLAPTSLDFGNVGVGFTTAGQTVTATNTGGSNLVVTSIGRGGANPLDFIVASQNCTAAPIPAGGTCSVTVKGKPTATGARAGRILFNDNAPASPQYASLTMTGTPAPAVGLSPTSLAFGDVKVGFSSAGQAVTITNTGSANLHISGFGRSGTNPLDFSVVSQNCTGAAIIVGGTCSVTVKAKPLVTGPRSGRLLVMDDAGNSPQVVPLTVNGTPAPVVSLSPSLVDFGSVPVSTTSSQMSITITNVGTADLTVTGFGRGGANPLDFALATQDCTGHTIAPGAFCTAKVTARPTTTGLRTGNLIITDNAGDSPQAEKLKVTGT